jgi:hypothetical protein
MITAKVEAIETNDLKLWSLVYCLAMVSSRKLKLNGSEPYKSFQISCILEIVACISFVCTLTNNFGVTSSDIQRECKPPKIFSGLTTKIAGSISWYRLSKWKFFTRPIARFSSNPLLLSRELPRADSHPQCRFHGFIQNEST